MAQEQRQVACDKPGTPGEGLITNHAMRSQVMAIMEAKGYVREFDRA